MIQKGSELYALVREDADLSYAEVLACAADPEFVAGRQDDFRFTTSKKKCRLVRVKLVVDQVLEEEMQRPVRIP